jgi:Zn-finger nucleic acid-binding protein
MSCGAELGLEPVHATECIGAKCPRCKHRQLDAFSNQDGTIFDCGQCGGQFVSRDVLATMVARHKAVVLDTPLRLHRSNPIHDAVTYIPCPFCRELMLRRNFGKVSGIVVDNCAKHGTWFDVGELSRVLSFVSAGGLQRTAEVQAEEQRLSHASLARPGQFTAHSGFALDSRDVEIRWSDIKDALREFVHAILGHGSDER